MQCPKCHSAFEEVEFAGVVVHRCTSCQGIWFDRSKHEYLKDVKDSEVIDVGDDTTGKANNTIVDYQCPECAAPMIRMVDPQQSHIWFESCAKCFGVYFDAGEFRDYKEITILDALRSLWNPERR